MSDIVHYKHSLAAPHRRAGPCEASAPRSPPNGRGRAPSRSDTCARSRRDVRVRSTFLHDCRAPTRGPRGRGKTWQAAPSLAAPVRAHPCGDETRRRRSRRTEHLLGRFQSGPLLDERQARSAFHELDDASRAAAAAVRARDHRRRARASCGIAARCLLRGEARTRQQQGRATSFRAALGRSAASAGPRSPLSRARDAARRASDARRKRFAERGAEHVRRGRHAAATR